MKKYKVVYLIYRLSHRDLDYEVAFKKTTITAALRACIDFEESRGNEISSIRVNAICE